MVDQIKSTLARELARGASMGGGKEAPEAAGKGSFAEFLNESLKKVNDLQTEADRAIEGLASGESKNVHDTMIAIEKANLSFNMMIQVRNKLLQAYEEIMRMQL